MTTQEDFFAEGPAEQVSDGLFSPDTAIMMDHIKEVIWEAENARDRSQQRVPGPSELGTECERKLAYATLGKSPVNHTADHWQAWVGTAVHAALAAAFERADNGSGRYLIEYRVGFVTEAGIVITGSLDIYDRLKRTVMDWKLPGSNSRRKYARSGPPAGYRIQAHCYAYGLENAGESPERVANIYLPPEGKLSDAFGWSEPYDRQVALDALARFDRINGQVQNDPAKIHLIDKTVTALCPWCSMYMPNSPDSAVGCQGGKGEN